MTTRSITPDFSALELPIDAWTQPYWDAAAGRRLIVPKCGSCATPRWPPGPFCPKCRSQEVEWVEPGQATIYSFNVMPVPSADKQAAPNVRIAALVTFPGLPRVRLVAPLVDAVPEEVQIDAPVEPDWIPAANASVLVFRLTSGAK